MHAVPDAQPRLPSYLLDKYCEKFPADSSGLDVFYLRPKVSSNTNVWYDFVPVGTHKLKKYFESMFKEAGISEKRRTITCVVLERQLYLMQVYLRN